MYDLIIIGAGPAGLTAALYALRAKKNVLIIESSTYGGQIIKANKIENYPGIKEISGYDYATNLYEQVLSFGGKMVIETVLKINVDKSVVTNKNTYSAKSIIIATGSNAKKIKLENEDKLLGKGVSYCATCDGNFFKDTNVAVVGCGKSSISEALYLSDVASTVYYVCKNDSVKETDIDFEKLKNKGNVEFMFNSTLTEIIGDNKLESINVKNNITGEISNIAVAGLFISIGSEPNNNAFTNVCDIDEKGYFISEDGVHTKVENIYIAGDARKKSLRQLTTAVSDGSIAATYAIREMKVNSD